MQYAVFDIAMPLKHISCGKLVSGNQWTHPRRIINSYVLILGLEGNAHIQQGNEKSLVKPGTALLLLPETEHFGYEKDKDVSYYWCHFSSEKGHTLCAACDSASQQENRDSAHVAVPAFAQEIQSDNSRVLFRQLLHTAGRQTPFSYQAHYLLTSLVLEISGQVSAANKDNLNNNKETCMFHEALEWIRISLNHDITLESISRHFHYNPEYFSRIFHRHTGQTLTQYLLTMRMEKARDILLNTSLSIKEVAWALGFVDEKYFMKTFKTHEGLTPTMYRNTAYFTHLNSN